MRASVNNRGLGQRRIRTVTAGLATLGVAGSLAVAGYLGIATPAVASTSTTKQPGGTSPAGTRHVGARGSSSANGSTSHRRASSDDGGSTGTVRRAPSAQPPVATSGGS
jgi:hypothetical protein